MTDRRLRDWAAVFVTTLIGVGSFAFVLFVLGTLAGLWGPF